MKLGWWDSPLIARPIWEVRGQSGKWYGLYNDFMCPHESLFGKRYGWFLVRDRRITDHLGEVRSFEIFRALTNAKDSADISLIKERFGTDPYDADESQKHHLYLKRFIENFNAANVDTQVQQFATRVETLDAELQAWEGEESALFADAAGLGAVQVTISTLFGMDTAWRPWYWKDQEGVYLQRDVTSIVYGSSVAPTAIRPPASKPVERIGLVRLKAPSILSRDRRTSFVLQTGRESAWTKGTEDNIDGNIGAFVTNSINDSVDNVERRVRRRAIDSAEALLRRRVATWFKGGVQIEFEDREDPLLLDLRNWFDQQGFGESQ